MEWGLDRHEMWMRHANLQCIWLLLCLTFRSHLECQFPSDAIQQYMFQGVPTPQQEPSGPQVFPSHPSRFYRCWIMVMRHPKATAE